MLKFFDNVRSRDNSGTSNISGNQTTTFSQSALSCGNSQQRVIHRLYQNFSFLQQGTLIPCTPNDSRSEPPGNTDPPKVQHVLVCVNTQRNRARLKQIPVHTDAKDGEIFIEIRARYFEVRGWRSVLTLRTVQMLRFVEVKMLRCCSDRYTYLLTISTGKV
jgi:hypothetical protein